MNYQIRNCLNNSTKWTFSFLSNLAQTIVSILRMMVLSSPAVARSSKNYKNLKLYHECCVLGNGPSLKDDLDSGSVNMEGRDFFCVNLFCLSPFFYELKPRFYFIIDGIFLKPDNERRKNKVQSLIDGLNCVDWDMFLVLSSGAISGSMLLKNLTNPHLKVIRVNSAEASGFTSFRHWVYRHRLGMPRCQTVLNFALCTAINLGYKNIYLFGADHTWTRDLIVDDNNIVRYGDRHVYNKDLTYSKKDKNFAQILSQFAKMFQAHYLLEQYSTTVGVKIWNCSSDSFLDAYERKK